MALILPDWYEGGYPDVEKLLRTLFQPLLANTSVVSWLPKPDTYQAQIASGSSYLRTYRTGGRINFDQRRDEPKVQFAALTGSRDDSWALIEFVRQILNVYEGGGTVAGAPGVQLWCAGEVVGPQLIPELLQDDRLVPVTIELHTRKSIPDYNKFL